MKLERKFAVKREERATKARVAAAKGERYRQWLEDEGLGEVFSELRSRYLDHASRLAIEKPEKAVRLLQAADIVDIVKSHIDVMVSGGVVAKKEMKNIVDLQTGKKREYF